MINCGRYWKDKLLLFRKNTYLSGKTEQNESYLPCPHCYRAIFVFSADNDYRYLCHVDAACRHGRPFMLLLVIAIERLIHTTYTLTTDDRLLLFTDAFPFGGNIPERHYLCGAGLVHENRTFRRDALCAGEVRNEGEMCRAASGEGRYVHKNPYESFK